MRCHDEGFNAMIHDEEQHFGASDSALMLTLCALQMLVLLLLLLLLCLLLVCLYMFVSQDNNSESCGRISKFSGTTTYRTGANRLNFKHSDHKSSK